MGNEFKHTTLSSIKSKKALKEFITRLKKGSTPEDSIRKSIEEKNENYDLLVGLLRKSSLEKAFNPMKLKGEAIEIPSEDEVITIIKPSVNALIGEELERNFEYRAYLTNPSDISQKEVTMKEEFANRLNSLVMDTELKGDMLKLELEKLNHWKSYSAQDVRERAANHIITDYKERLELKTAFKEMWKDVIAVNEEACHVGLYNGNVVVDRIDTRDLEVYHLGNSAKLEEAGVIIWSRYMQPGMIIERYYDVLSKADVAYVMGDTESRQPEMNSSTSIPSMTGSDNSLRDEGVLVIDTETNRASSIYSKAGKVDGVLNVTTTYVRTVRPVLNVTGINDEGEEWTRLEDKSYELDSGETSVLRYVNEWYEATEIGNNVWVDIRPCPVQVTDMNNLSLNKPPIVGFVHKYSSVRGQSIVDVLKPIQYEWAIFSKKMSHLWARNLGKLVRIDVSKIPTDMSRDAFFNWIKSFGVILENPFEESNMNGVMSGQFGSSVSAVDVDLSSSIQGVLQHMMYLQQLADDTVGVNRQRRGELMTSDGKGVTQEAIGRSNKMTEEFFYEHDNVKKRVFALVLEYVKLSVKNGTNVKAQYILGDMANVIYDTEGSGFEEASFGIMITNGRKRQELEQIFQQLAHAAMQSGTITISQIMELYNTDSMSEKINTLKTREEENRIRREEQQKQDRELQQQLQQAMLQDKEADRKHEIDIANIKAQASIEVALINADKHDTATERDVERDASNNAHKEATLAQRKQENLDRLGMERERLNASRSNKK